MPVTIRFFAALRDAAGTSKATVDPGPLPDVLRQLETRFGERFTSRLRAASVLIDGDPVPRGAQVEVHDGAEVALLPPFSGGSSALPIRAPRGERPPSAPGQPGPVAA